VKQDSRAAHNPRRVVEETDAISSRDLNLEQIHSAVCFNRSSADDLSLWPSDHAGVWVDLQM
jgi:hypothetical protein